MPESRHDRAHAASGALDDALARLGSPASIVEPEKLGGRATGRVRLVLRSEHARALARRLATVASDSSTSTTPT